MYSITYNPTCAKCKMHFALNRNRFHRFGTSQKKIKENNFRSMPSNPRLRSMPDSSGPSKRAKSNKKSTTSDSVKKMNKKKNPRSIVVVPRPLPIPYQLNSTLTYSQDINITFNASGYGWTLFSCNGLYDPDLSGVGHQPMYFDQLMDLYNHYTVLSSYIEVTPLGNVGVPDALQQTIACYIDDDTSTGITSWNYILERIGCVSKDFNLGTSGPPKLKKFWNASSTFPGDALSRDELQGTVTTNPTEQSVFVVAYAGGISLATSSRTVRVKVVYNAVFDEWKSIAAS